MCIRDRLLFVGLICGYVFSPNQGSRPMDLHAAAEWLQANREAESPDFVWLHFSLSKVSTQTASFAARAIFRDPARGDGIDPHRARRRLPDRGHQQLNLITHLNCETENL